MDTFDKNPDHPPLGFEQHAPRWTVRIMYLILGIILCGGLIGFCMGVTYVVSWIAKRALGI